MGPTLGAVSSHVIMSYTSSLASSLKSVFMLHGDMDISISVSACSSPGQLVVETVSDLRAGLWLGLPFAEMDRFQCGFVYFSYPISSAGFPLS